jgi:hypothetical protein
MRLLRLVKKRQFPNQAEETMQFRAMTAVLAMTCPAL